MTTSKFDSVNIELFEMIESIITFGNDMKYSLY